VVLRKKKRWALTRSLGSFEARNGLLKSPSRLGEERSLRSIRKTLTPLRGKSQKGGKLRIAKSEQGPSMGGKKDEGEKRIKRTQKGP